MSAAQSLDALITRWDDLDTNARAKALRLAKRSAHPHPAFPSLRRIARELGWPLQFEADLHIHDRRALASADPATRFVWSIGPTGTHLSWCAHKGIDSARSFALYLEGERPRSYLWDGRDLIALTPTELPHILMGREWRPDGVYHA